MRGIDTFNLRLIYNKANYENAMKLYIAEYIENILRKAEYEYDQETKSWCASAGNLPGAYAQAGSVEEAREQLTEVIEDYILTS
jgi:hypothetical protein